PSGSGPLLLAPHALELRASRARRLPTLGGSSPTRRFPVRLAPGRGLGLHPCAARLRAGVLWPRRCRRGPRACALCLVSPSLGRGAGIAGARASSQRARTLTLSPRVRADPLSGR